MNEQLRLLEAITRYLAGLNTAAPVIFGAITMIASLFRGITGSGPTMLECADLIERSLDENDTKIRTEIARLRAELNPSDG